MTVLIIRSSVNSTKISLRQYAIYYGPYKQVQCSELLGRQGAVCGTHYQHLTFYCLFISITSTCSHGATLTSMREQNPTRANSVLSHGTAKSRLDHTYSYRALTVP